MPLVIRSFSAYRRSLRPGRRRCRWLLRERPGEHSPRLAACRGARGRHRVRSGKIKTSSAERAWVLPSRLTGRASPGKAQWQLRPRSAYRRLREEWCEQAEGAGLLDGLGTAARAEFDTDAVSKGRVIWRRCEREIRPRYGA
jgi:hypothetical protein